MILSGSVETVVRRITYLHSRADGRDTLVQRFQFNGPSADADAIRDILLTAPLIGDNSVFGNCAGEETNATDRARTVRGFSPAPGFRFDVDITQTEGKFLVRFSQPERNMPYLQGDLLWTIHDDSTGAVLDEQINTQQASEAGAEPLGGPQLSFRRWLFFRIGHKQVMTGASRNIAALVDRDNI